MDAAAVRRAASAAQAILRDTAPDMIIDGKPGSFTMRAYTNSSAQLREEVDRLVVALGFAGGMPALNEAYNKALTERKPGDGTDVVFDLQVVPALVREARRRGINPLGPIAQLALETGWGRATPRMPDGTPSFNYGGIKASSFPNGRTPAVAATREYKNGKWVTEKAEFASFANADEFAKAFFQYVLDGKSSYRYKQYGADKAQTPEQWANALSRGGYATDPSYTTKVVSIAKTAASRYALA